MRRWILACATIALPPLVCADPLPTRDFLSNVGAPPCTPGAFAMMAQGADESIYVAGSDAYGTACVQRFSADGRSLWAVPVTGSTGFVEITGIAVDAAGDAYVALTDGDGYPATAFIAKYDLGGGLMQAIPMPLPAGVGAAFSAGTAFDRTRGVLYAGEYYNAPSGPEAMIAALTPALSVTAYQTMSGVYEASVSMDSTGNAYLGGSGADASGNSVYLAAQWAPRLASSRWSVTMPFPITRFSRETNTADYNGGMVFLGLEAGFTNVLRRVSASGGSGATAALPEALVGYTLASDEQSAVYMRGVDSHRTPAGLLKVDASGAPVWGTLLSEGSPHLQLLGAPAQNRKIYTYGYDDGSQLYPAPAYLARYSQGGVKLSMTLGPASVPPSKLDGTTSSTTKVLIHASDPQGNPVANQTVNISATAVESSGGHDGPNHASAGRPVGTLSATSCTTNTNGDCAASGGGAPTYTAGLFGGQDTLTAQSGSATATAALTVAVPSLESFPAVPTLYPFKQWTLTGQTTSPGSVCGAGLSIHPANHWVTPATQDAVISAVESFYLATGVSVGLNDMSLPNGGLFDICGKWTPPHQCHRAGEAVDVDAGSLGGMGSAMVQTLTTFMARYGGVRIHESNSLHYQFPGTEIKRCHPRVSS